mmetsp:Transcript_70483/g.215889  ORF Transcript_70483/g.215889 Transcript_70483/m.215889 type:complete len:313 (+) Transcript_70483:316-1254(+)
MHVLEPPPPGTCVDPKIPGGGTALWEARLRKISLSQLPQGRPQASSARPAEPRAPASLRAPPASGRLLRLRARHRNEPRAQPRLHFVHRRRGLPRAQVDVALRELAQLLRHHHDADVHEMHAAEGQRAALQVLLPRGVQRARHLRPMQPRVGVVDDVVPVVERGLVDGRVDAIVRQRVVARAVRWVDEHVLRPIAERHGGHGKEVGHDEHPNSGSHVHALRQERDDAQPRGKPTDDGHEPLVPLGPQSVHGQLEVNEENEAEPISSKVEPRVPLKLLGRGGIKLVIVFDVVHDAMVQLVETARNAEHRREDP